MSYPKNNNHFEIAATCRQNIYKLRRGFKPLNVLINNLTDKTKFEVGIFGGAVRDWYTGKTPKDLDIVVFGSQEDFHDSISGIFFSDHGPNKISRTNLGGYKIDLGKLQIDLWRMQDSWVFQQDKNLPITWENLTRSVLFNSDAIIYNLTYDTVYESGFLDFLETKQLELLSTVSPHPDSFILKRALRFLTKYDAHPDSKMLKWMSDFGLDYEKYLKEVKTRENYDSNWKEKMEVTKSLSSNEKLDDILTKVLTGAGCKNLLDELIGPRATNISSNEKYVKKLIKDDSFIIPY